MNRGVACALIALIYERFLETREKKELAEAFDNFRRSSAILQLSLMQFRGLLTEEEIARLGPETHRKLMIYKQAREGK